MALVSWLAREADVAEDKLYIGTATGAIQVYNFLAGQGSKGLPKLEWVRTYNIARRQIDQIGILPNAGYLLVLSGTPFLLRQSNSKDRNGVC